MIMKLSVIVPIYNEEDIIDEMIERIVNVCKQYSPFEIICVDDGSKDSSFSKLKLLKEKYQQLKLLKFESNCGQSNAFAAGFKHAQGELVATLDADLQVPPEELPKLMECIEDCDVVIGWRHERQDSGAKIFAGGFANKFRNMFLHDGAHDTGCPLKLFRKEALESFYLFNGSHRFYPALAKMNGFKVSEVKVSHQKRTVGTSKYGTFSRAIPAFFDLLGVLWIRKRKLNFKIDQIVE